MYWIGSDHPFDLHEVYLDFRRTFSLGVLPARAELCITADSRYKLWVNGVFVARGPARCYPHAQAVDSLDITPYLRVGENVIAAQVYQPGYSHFAYVHCGAAGLWAQLDADGARVLATDERWRVRRDPSFDSLVPRVSIYGSGVEDRDLAQDADWHSPAYDDATWATPRIVAPTNGSPWTVMQARTLPLLVERELPMTLLETRIGAAAQVRDAHLALREGWQAAEFKPFAPDEHSWFSSTLAENQAAYWLYDLGRDYIGQGWAEIENASGAETLAVSYHEKMRRGELVISDPSTYCRVRLTDRFRLRAGNQRAESFALRGSRYILFQLIGPAPGVRVRFHARVSEYPLEVTRQLRPTDATLAGVVRMCEDTMRACLQDGFIDSTWRESSQWTGDALPHALTLSAMCDDVRPLRRVIEMAAQDPYPDGVLPSVLPGQVHAYTVVDYNFVWVELLLLYWQLTHDAEFTRGMWSTLTRMLDRFDADCGADGLIRSQPGRRLFLDWSPQSRGEPNAVYNLHYALALDAAAQLAEALGETERGALFAARGNALKAAARFAFWREGRWYDDLPGTTFSQLAAALAVLTGAARADESSLLLDALAARSLDAEDSPAPGKMVLASPFMHHYVFEALRRGGRDDAVTDIIKRRWGRWVAAGYPTTWENWNVDFPDGSQCHAFSAHPRYHLAMIMAGR